MPLAPAVATSLAGSRVLDPLADASGYRVQVFRSAIDFSVGDLIADIVNPQNIGYADYANQVPEMFMTLHQDHDQLPDILPFLGSAHYRVYRGRKVVHAGWLMESDESEDDVVLYGYGYLAGLFWYLSSWDQTFTSNSVGDIVRALWRRTITFTSPMLSFVKTGHIEGAQNGSDGAGEIVLPQYPLYYKRILHAFQELAALGLSDTSQNVLFEITQSDVPVFNWWHDRGARRPYARLTYGDGGQIIGFRRRRSPIFRRNNVLAVGSTPHTTLLRKEVSNASDMSSQGRRQEPLFLSWVRDETELDRVAKLRLKQGMREDFDLSVDLRPGSFIPPAGFGSQVQITDSLPIKIERGATRIDRYMMLAGYQVIYDGEEKVNLLLQEDRHVDIAPTGSPQTLLSDAAYNAFPAIARLANGNLICVYRSGTDHIAPPADGNLYSRTSSDNGLSWSAPVTVWDHATLDVRDPAVSVMANGTVVVTTTTYSGTGGVETGTFLAYIIKSTDNGATWGAPIAVGSAFTVQREVGGAPVVELASGTWMIPIAGRLTTDSSTTEKVIMLFSTNSGATWGSPVTVASEVGQFYTEPVVLRLSNGMLHCLIRENNNGVTYRTVSHDSGATWSAVERAFDSASKPAHAQLADGSLLAVVRSAGVTPQACYRFSYDLGVSWSDEHDMNSPGLTKMYAGIVIDNHHKALVVYGVENSSTDADILIQRFD